MGSWRGWRGRRSGEGGWGVGVPIHFPGPGAAASWAAHPGWTCKVHTPSNTPQSLLGLLFPAQSASLIGLASICLQRDRLNPVKFKAAPFMVPEKAPSGVPLTLPPPPPHPVPVAHPFWLYCRCQPEVASDLSFIQSSLARRRTLPMVEAISQLSFWTLRLGVYV